MLFGNPIVGEKSHTLEKNIWYELHNKLHIVLCVSEKVFYELYKK